MSRSSGGLADGGNHCFSPGGRVAIPDVKTTPAGRAARCVECPGRSSLSRSGAVGAVGGGSAIDRTGRASQRARELVGGQIVVGHVSSCCSPMSFGSQVVVRRDFGVNPRCWWDIIAPYRKRDSCPATGARSLFQLPSYRLIPKRVTSATLA